ncbi:hypothetical protein [Parabacteroides sp.]
MTKLSDLLDEDSLKDIAQHTVQVGDVFRIKMDQRNGIVPKKGDDSRNKFFIVLGFDSDGNIYGGVIINSNINQYVPQAVRDWQMPIKCSKYAFLEHDSFVDCSKLKIASVEKFSTWKYLGSVESEDVEIILGTIKESPNETQEHLAMFGL